MDPLPTASPSFSAIGRAGAQRAAGEAVALLRARQALQSAGELVVPQQLAVLRAVAIQAHDAELLLSCLQAPQPVSTGRPVPPPSPC